VEELRNKEIFLYKGFHEKIIVFLLNVPARAMLEEDSLGSRFFT